MKTNNIITGICLATFIWLWLCGLGAIYFFWGYIGVGWIKYGLIWAVLTGLSLRGAVRKN